MMYGEHVFLDRFAAAAKDGFDAVEYLFPYDFPAAELAKRLADHGQGTALLFARTETAMFHRLVWNRASALLFLRGRVVFHRANGERSSANAGAPSVLIAYGHFDALALESANQRAMGQGAAGPAPQALP